MNTTVTVRTHLRKAWDQYFMPGATSSSRAVPRFLMACKRVGLVVVSEYRENHPAPGLSGVLFTRLPRGMKADKRAGLRGDRTAGL